MLLTPRYEAPPIVALDGPPGEVLAPLVRQRRRLEQALADLEPEQWAAPSRCEGWTVQDVIAHLIGTNSFWEMSVLAGVAGEPTRILAAFDPAATPAVMVAGMRALTPADVLAQFTATNDGFLAAVDSLDDDGWAVLAESPPGHVPIKLLAAHALWDSWVHERDVLLHLGVDQVAEPDELGICLRYSAALSPGFAIMSGTATPGSLGITTADDPTVDLVVDVGDCVAVSLAPTGDRPCLRGEAVDLIEALSIRRPLPADAPPEWHAVLRGLATVFDQ
jgi:uncharacterized protein (TIGR03083 family)